MTHDQHPVASRIRIGTFNVNGKLPSQDLSSWVQGGSSPVPTTDLPQIATVSPLSIGEITSGGGKDAEVNPFDTTTTRQPSVNEDGVELEPTLLVLGFQELDLSTEALIYNTGPAKEDAWVTACIAGLGEKGDDWEKVSSSVLPSRARSAIRKSYSFYLSLHSWPQNSWSECSL